MGCRGSQDRPEPGLKIVARDRGRNLIGQEMRQPSGASRRKLALTPHVDSLIFRGSAVEFCNKLGEGSSGSVYSAAWEQQEIAVKFSLRDNIKREAIAIGRLNAVNIRCSPKLYGHLVEGGNNDSALLLELLDARSLADRLRACGTHQGKRALMASKLSELIAGLRSCHEAGVRHGDLKLQHVLFRRGGSDEMVLIDWGAGALPHFAGTQRYYAPPTLAGDFLALSLSILDEFNLLHSLTLSRSTSTVQLLHVAPCAVVYEARKLRERLVQIGCERLLPFLPAQ